MNESPWDRPVCIICDYGWIIGILIVLSLLLYFTRNILMPVLGL